MVSLAVVHLRQGMVSSSWSCKHDIKWNALTMHVLEPSEDVSKQSR